jgi:hypothetical protein
MPWSALGEPGYGQPAPPNQAVLGKRIGGVLTAGRNKPARRRSQWRDHVTVQPDQKDQASRGPLAGLPDGPQDCCPRLLPQSHRSVPANSKARRRPLRSCCSNHAEDTFRLLGRARITTRSAWSRPLNTVRATCRSRRATRCRSTAEPTGLAMIKPMRGPVPSSSRARRTWTMTSRCTVRLPNFTVSSNSVDRLMRLRAGSTARNLSFRSGS